MFKRTCGGAGVPAKVVSPACLPAHHGTRWRLRGNAPPPRPGAAQSTSHPGSAAAEVGRSRHGNGACCPSGAPLLQPAPSARPPLWRAPPLWAPCTPLPTGPDSLEPQQETLGQDALALEPWPHLPLYRFWAAVTARTFVPSGLEAGDSPMLCPHRAKFRLINSP